LNHKAIGVLPQKTATRFHDDVVKTGGFVFEHGEFFIAHRFNEA
jgi:hypothetical protein